MPIMHGGGILIHEGTRDDPTLDVYKCTGCGTKFLSRIDVKDYENGYMYETDGLLSDLDIEKNLDLAHKDDLRRFETVKSICLGKNVLDFGCGFGGFLDNISKVADTCCGVEPGKIERGYLNKKGIHCLKSIDEWEKKFDVITLFHVFEHLQDPRAWLDKFSSYLTDEGYLIIEVPNADDALLALYGSEKFADFTYWSAHIFLYTVKSLSMVIEESGRYNIVSVEQVQRYPISNHLMWLAKGFPGGHDEWGHLESKELNRAYEKKLSELQMCDTLFFIVRLKNDHIS